MVAVFAREMFPFLKLHLDLLHFLARVHLRPHVIAFSQHLGAERKKQDGGQDVGEALRNETWHGMAENGREDRHGNQGRESGREDEQSRMLHGHQGSNEKGLVPDFGNEDHRQREDEGL